MTEHDTTQVTFEVPWDARKERLDKFLAAQLAESGYSRERIKELIKTNAVRVDGTTCGSPKWQLAGGSSVTVDLPAIANALQAEEGPVLVLYRDDDIIIIDKPANLTVHPCPSCPEGTLVNRLLHHFPELEQLEGSRPGIVHRLDKDTTGLLIVALTERIRLALNEQFAGRDIYKEYLALAHGVPKMPTGIIDAPIDRHPTQKTKMCVSPKGREAKSSYTVLYADPEKRFSLLAVRIFTGRTHQIRVHLQHIGHPILGDPLYTAQHTKVSTAFTRPMLHAWRLSLTHPGTEQHMAAAHITPGTIMRREGAALAFTCPPPHDFIQALHQLLDPFIPVVITGMPGCGKSTLLRRLEDMGLPTISADAIVTQMGLPGGDIARILQARFGSRFIDHTQGSPTCGGVNKKALADAMMADNDLKREVELLVHPLVYSAIDRFFENQKNKSAPFALAEIPLFFESRPVQDTRPTGSRAQETPPSLLAKPYTVGVYSPFPLRRQRLLEKRGWTPGLVDAMESWQWPEEKKMNACDYVVHNTEQADTEKALLPEATLLIHTILSLRENRNAQIFERLQELWCMLPAACTPSLKTETEKYDRILFQR